MFSGALSSVAKWKWFVRVPAVFFKSRILKSRTPYRKNPCKLKMTYKKCMRKVLAIPISKYLTELSVRGHYFLAAFRKDS